VVFINDRIASTRRIYLPGEKAVAVKVNFEGDNPAPEMTVWQVKPISKDRLTT